MERCGEWPKHCIEMNMSGEIKIKVGSRKESFEFGCDPTGDEDEVGS